MIRLAKLCLLALAAGVWAATAATDTARLPAAQLQKAVRSDSISIPTPGELFAALEKPGKTNWSAQYREPIPMTYRNRAQIALNLGGLVADGFIAVEAKDSQQVKNIGSDIIKLAKALGVSEKLLSRALTNLRRTTSGTRYRKNWKRRKTKSNPQCNRMPTRTS
ncbi:MAG: hypothetical protein DME76_08930 [Verrucomicrobia bacterium]|nr:MAG: hypothetical protein DME76_08930 [Verrucomicrobiota bacterium]